LIKLTDFSATPGRVTISGAPEGSEGLVLAALARKFPAVLHIARDDARMARIAESLAFFAPDVQVFRFPAWDCLPYDRVSPNPALTAERIATLIALTKQPMGPLVVVTTVNAAIQRVPPRASFTDCVFSAGKGERLDLAALNAFLVRNGYNRAATVREPGEYAIRGGIVDIFPPGADDPVRVDLFGDEIERIRAFDPMTQLSASERDGFALEPVSEAPLDRASIERFRTGYRERFGAATDDPVYEAVSQGRRHPGYEHWLSLLYERMETLFDYVPEAAVTLDFHTDEVRDTRFETIADYYEARSSLVASNRGEGAAPYRPLPPRMLYLEPAEWNRVLAARWTGALTPFSEAGEGRVLPLGGRAGPDFAAQRAGTDTGEGVFGAVREHIQAAQGRGRRVVVAAYSNGSRERLRALLTEHGVAQLAPVEDWPAAEKLPVATAAIGVLALEHGFVLDGATVVGEQDILGDRLIRSTRRKRRAENFIADVGDLAPGDLVVHIDHGIGRYDGLETIHVSGAPHDCLRLTYAGNDRLFIPVENVEVLSRYGSEDATAALDRLGGAHWQARKARLKERLSDMAGELIKIAAQRAVREADRLQPPSSLFDEFCARFPYQETEDQARAIDETLADLTTGKPMDRIICGDVGFGKTEIALRATFAAVMAGGQVALIAPTTLLVRQHYALFKERFANVPVTIAQLSRFSAPRDAAAVKRGLETGEIDIAIGTHALLGKAVKFKKLSLLIVDEEQHFGVGQKERLKQLRADVHVLTLSATPIPRTLQMALAGVKDMSVIATPPVDRLAVRTFVLPYDPLVVREAIMREHFRGGQTFYVCPRIEDLGPMRERLATLVPEVKIGVAHGQMPVRDLEAVMTAFYERRVELLLSTQIIESGLDLPSANTLIVHRADMFGLAQLYQLRGRVGRSKVRAYCYLTIPTDRPLTETAQKRLEVMQTLDRLGAGFSLASHDLDIRGAGNLLGEEQSGHIREVGVELYQRMLEEAIAAARGERPAEEGWTPQITVDIPVLIPETYVTDLGVRLGLYRRIAGLEDKAAIEAFAAEMIDRFGTLPPEVENLLKVVEIKQACKAAGIARLEVGPKGATVAFRDNTFVNPAGLVQFMSGDLGRTTLRPERLVVRREWGTPKSRLAGAHELAMKLAEIAAKPPEATVPPPSRGPAAPDRGSERRSPAIAHPKRRSVPR